MTVSWLRVLSILFLYVCVSETPRNYKPEQGERSYKPEQGERSGSQLLEGPGIWGPGTRSLQG